MKQNNYLRAEKLPKPGNKYWNKTRQELGSGVDQHHPVMKGLNDGAVEEQL